MNSPTWLVTHETHDAHEKEPSRKSAELITTYAERLAIQELERAERRRADRAEQTSTLNAPDVRIRAWEKLHGLRMPLSTGHPVLEQISVATGLSLSQIQEEQLARSARRKSNA
jgi:hypothetical protein